MWVLARVFDRMVSVKEATAVDSMLTRPATMCQILILGIPPIPTLARLLAVKVSLTIISEFGTLAAALSYICVHMHMHTKDGVHTPRAERQCPWLEYIHNRNTHQCSMVPLVVHLHRNIGKTPVMIDSDFTRQCMIQDAIVRIIAARTKVLPSMVPTGSAYLSYCMQQDMLAKTCTGWQVGTCGQYRSR